MSAPRRPFLFCLACCLVAVASLTGCGFQLRGTVEIPPDLSPAYVAGGGGTANFLRHSFESHGRTLAASAAEARLIIRVPTEDRSIRVMSVNREGKVIAQELGLRVRFEATAPDGTVKLAAQDIRLVRDFVNPDTEVLGKQLEADLIFEDMQHEAAERILQRLRTVLL